MKRYQYNPIRCQPETLLIVFTHEIIEKQLERNWNRFYFAHRCARTLLDRGRFALVEMSYSNDGRDIFPLYNVTATRTAAKPTAGKSSGSFRIRPWQKDTFRRQPPLITRVIRHAPVNIHTDAFFRQKSITTVQSLG